MTPDPRYWMGRTVAVVGGTGFLGGHLVARLLDVGANVRVFGLPAKSSHPSLERADVRFGDVGDIAALRAHLMGCSVVFNAAGVVAATSADRESFYRSHVEAVRNVRCATDARIVHTSSITTVGATREGIVLDEDATFRPERLGVDYVLAKRASEDEARTDAVIVNPGYLVGPEDFGGSIVGRLCVRFWNGRVPVAPPGGFNFVDVRDVATGHLLAAERGAVGRRYILGGENRSLVEFFRLLAEVAGYRPRGLPRLAPWAMWSMALLAEGRARLVRKRAFPSFQEAELNRYCWYVSSQRARRELGYAARPLLECLSDSYRWHRAAGRLRKKLGGLQRWWLRPAA